MFSKRGRKKSLIGNQDKRLLVVKLKQARDILAVNAAKNSSNPYAVLQLLTESGLESKLFSSYIISYSLLIIIIIYYH
jgi:hypothetical protein